MRFLFKFLIVIMLSEHLLPVAAQTPNWKYTCFTCTAGAAQSIIRMDSLDNSYVINPYDITKLSPNGTVLWQVHLPSYQTAIYNALIDSNYLVIVGANSQQHVFIKKLDLNTRLVVAEAIDTLRRASSLDWQHHNAFAFNFGLEVRQGNYYVVFATPGRSITSFYRLSLFKYNRNLQLLNTWESSRDAELYYNGIIYEDGSVLYIDKDANYNPVTVKLNAAWTQSTVLENAPQMNNVLLEKGDSNVIYSVTVGFAASERFISKKRLVNNTLITEWTVPWAVPNFDLDGMNLHYNKINNRLYVMQFYRSALSGTIFRSKMAELNESDGQVLWSEDYSDSFIAGNFYFDKQQKVFLAGRHGNQYGFGYFDTKQVNGQWQSNLKFLGRYGPTTLGYNSGISGAIFTSDNKIVVTGSAEEGGVSGNKTTTLMYHLPRAAFTYQLSPNNCTQVQFANQSSGTQFLWQFGDSTTSTLREPMHLYNRLGTYQVTLIADALNGIKDTTVQTLIIGGRPTIAISSVRPLPICGGDSTVLVATSNATGATYRWSTGQTEDRIMVRQRSVYQVTVTDALGCSDTASLRVTFTPTADFNVTLQGGVAQFQNLSTGANQYFWRLDNLSTGNNENPIYTYTTNGTYRVCLTATNAANCRDSICKDVNVTRIGVQDLPEGVNAQVSPNPTSDYLEVVLTLPPAFQTNGQLRLTDLVGKQVLLMPSADSYNRLNMTNLASGMYFLQLVVNGNAYYLAKIIKKE